MDGDGVVDSNRSLAASGNLATLTVAGLTIASLDVALFVGLVDSTRRLRLTSHLVIGSDLSLSGRSGRLGGINVKGVGNSGRGRNGSGRLL